MTRITQSFLTNSLVLQLGTEGWKVLYADFSDARRGGGGTQGKVNQCLETLFDEFPDIIAIKDHVLLICEVDIGFKQSYVDKLGIFLNRKDELIKCLQNNIEITISTISTRLVFQRKPSKTIQGVEVWLYNKKENKFVMHS